MIPALWNPLIAGYHAYLPARPRPIGSLCQRLTVRSENPACRQRSAAGAPPPRRRLLQNRSDRFNRIAWLLQALPPFLLLEIRRKTNTYFGPFFHGASEHLATSGYFSLSRVRRDINDFSRAFSPSTGGASLKTGVNRFQSLMSGENGQAHFQRTCSA